MLLLKRPDIKDPILHLHIFEYLSVSETLDKINSDACGPITTPIEEWLGAFCIR